VTVYATAVPSAFATTELETLSSRFGRIGRAVEAKTEPS
jgi:hypothetical protein